MDIAGEDGAIGTVLDLDPLGGHVDGGIAVVPLQRGDRLLLPRLRPTGRRREGGYCKDDASFAHAHHLTAPCTIFKRAPPSSTTLCSPRSARMRLARNWPSRIAPCAG